MRTATGNTGACYGHDNFHHRQETDEECQEPLVFHGVKAVTLIHTDIRNMDEKIKCTKKHSHLTA